LLDDKRAEIGSVQGPTERRLLGRLRQNRLDESDSGDALLKPIAGIEDYRKAEQLYEEQDFPAAEKAFKKVAKEYKKSEIREDALFMEGEAAYAQDRYSRAHDLYAQLLKDYPTTRHLDQISARMFKIAMVWLDHPQVAEVGEIQQVNHDNYAEKLPPAASDKPPKRNVLLPNFTDRTRPVFDPQGNALVALRSIWTNDPSGPLADDALMLTASYHARAGDFVEADRHFTMLREQFPNSPHVQKAFELGSHVKLMSYQGAPYDGQTLQDAEQLKLATLRLYPEMEGRERMEAQLKKIEEAKADRLWSMVVFYERKGRKKAAATYCHMLIAEHPESKYVAEAKTRLAKYGVAYADGQALLNPYPDPPPTLWTAIFPPDDHGGVPRPPNGVPGSTLKPERVKIAGAKPREVDEAPAPAKTTSKPPRSAKDDIPRRLPEDSDDEPRSAADDFPEEDDSGHTRL